MVLMDTIEFRLLRITDQYVHETIRIMKLPLIGYQFFRFTALQYTFICIILLSHDRVSIEL